MRSSDWSSDVCSSDLRDPQRHAVLLEVNHQQVEFRPGYDLRLRPLYEPDAVRRIHHEIAGLEFADLLCHRALCFTSIPKIPRDTRTRHPPWRAVRRPGGHRPTVRNLVVSILVPRFAGTGPGMTLRPDSEQTDSTTKSGRMVARGRRNVPVAAGKRTRLR